MVYTEEQKQVARNTDIINFLETEHGFSFKKSGTGYRCVEHDSLCIYADRKGFFWNSRQTGGANAIDFLIKVDKKNFPEALKRLVGEPIGKYEKRSTRQNPSFETTQKRDFAIPKEYPFKLPTSAENHRRVFAYLSQTRKIAPEIISSVLHEKKLFQDTRGNCVFVGTDKENNPKYAALRGTLSDKQFRGEVGNSDKSYGFSLKGQDSSRLYVFESPIDVLSHATIANIATNDKNAWKMHNRLSLGGVCNNALDRYLSENPQIKEIVFALDNDSVGRNSSQQFLEKYSKSGYSVREVVPKNKDFNDDLKIYSEKNKKLDNTANKEKETILELTAQNKQNIQSKINSGTVTL